VPGTLHQEAPASAALHVDAAEQLAQEVEVSAIEARRVRRHEVQTAPR